MTSDQDPLHLSCPAQIAHLPELLALVEAACTRARASVALRHDLLLMAEEACVNVMRHAYPSDSPGRILLRVATGMRTGRRQMQLTIEDRGIPFDPCGLPAPDVQASAEDRPVGGLGIMLMRQLSDRLTYRRDPVRGNVLTIEKWLLPDPAATTQGP